MDCECINNISLSESTWIHRGGNANYYYIPNSVEELIEVGRYLYSDKREFLTIGHTSNIYFKNSFNIDNIIEYIKGSNDFVVTSHVSPDGDNIGSTLGIYYTLKKLNKNVYYVLDDNIPLNLRFLVENIVLCVPVRSENAGK